MLVAAFGWLPAAVGALLQEVIDVPPSAMPCGCGWRPSAQAPACRLNGWRFSKSIAAEHEEVRPIVDRIRTVATTSRTLIRRTHSGSVRELLTRLQADLLPHEEREERTATGDGRNPGWPGPDRSAQSDTRWRSPTRLGAWSASWTPRI